MACQHYETNFIYDGGSKLSNDGAKRCLTVRGFCNSVVDNFRMFGECFPLQRINDVPFNAFSTFENVFRMF